MLGAARHFDWNQHAAVAFEERSFKVGSISWKSFYFVNKWDDFSVKAVLVIRI